jgi:hypothetical protein
MGGRGGHARLRLKGWGSPNSNEGTFTVVLYIYKYFVVTPYQIKVRSLESVLEIEYIYKIYRLLKSKTSLFYFIIDADTV